MFVMHPVFLMISLVTAILYSTDLNGREDLFSSLKLYLPIVIITSIINPAFNNRGTTILTYLPSGNPLTLESIIYGAVAGTMLAASLSWFKSFNIVMTSEKFVYLFGRIIPSLSLVLSMALRFIPKFTEQIKNVSNTQKAIGRDVSNGGLFARARQGITILSITVTWALENAIETSDSMKSRGYGLSGRSSFSIYQFDKRDKWMLLILLFLGSYILIGIFTGNLQYQYLPSLQGNEVGFYSISIWFAFLLLCLSPIIANKEEKRQWEATQLNI